MRIASVGCALPPHRYAQEELLAGFRSLWPAGHPAATLADRLHRSVRVGARHLALPIEAYAHLSGFKARNEAFVRAGTDLAEEALRRALAEGGLAPADLDALYFTSVTGIATPSIDARLVNRLGLRPEVRRIPIFGLGCVAGAAGIARMADYLRAFPEHAAALVSVELCSLTLQRDDPSVANVVASGLFADGAAAVVAVGERRAGGATGPRVLATRSRFYHDTERVMGWDVGDDGFKVVLSAEVPEIVRRFIAEDVDGFLEAKGRTRRDIARWICHPGGPRVLEAFEAALGLGRADLDLTWRSLAEIGNLSSASVLFVLRDTLRERPAPPGAPALLIAMGPGFCSELVLLEF